jgi:hypothetical protein
MMSARLRFLSLVVAVVIAASCRESDPSAKALPPVPAPVHTDTGFTIQVFKNVDQGYGYSISISGRKVFNQPNIPAIQHVRSFETAAEAEAVAGLVKQKLEAHILLPALTIHDLDSLHIHYR